MALLPSSEGGRNLTLSHSFPRDRAIAVGLIPSDGSGSMRLCISVFSLVLLAATCWGQTPDVGKEKKLPDDAEFGVYSLSDVSAEHRFIGSFYGLKDGYRYESLPYIGVSGLSKGKDDEGNPIVSNVWQQQGAHWTLTISIVAYNNDDPAKNNIDIRTTTKNILDNRSKRFTIVKSSVEGNDGTLDNCYLRNVLRLTERASAGNLVYEKIVIEPKAAMTVEYYTDVPDNSQEQQASWVLANFQRLPYAYRKECGPVSAP